MKNKTSSVILQAVITVVGLAVLLIAYVAVCEHNDAAGYKYYTFLAALIIYFLQISLHELGHLVCGLISGYSFVSYRIFSLMIVREGGRFRIKRYKLSGTAGQCLMAPNLEKRENTPTLLYNLGGVIADSVVCATSLLLSVLLNENHFIFSSATLLSAFAFYSVLANGIPMRAGIACNDGYNVRSLAENASAAEAMARTLEITSRAYLGDRLRDMPSYLFEYDGNFTDNIQVSSLAYYKFCLLLDRREHNEAFSLGLSLLNGEGALLPLYRALISAEMAYISAVEYRDSELASSFIGKDEKRVLDALANIPTVHRVRYTLALLASDGKAAAKSLADFKRAQSGYPCPADVESENEALAYAESALLTSRDEPFCRQP